MDLSKVDRKMLDMVVDFCVLKLGYSKFCPRFPRIILYRNILSPQKKSRMGYYDPFSNTLVIYRSAHKNLTEFIDTIIHEYVHYLQDHEEYEVLSKSHGYKDHPHEIEAVSVAKKLTPRAKLWIKKQLFSRN